MGDQIIITIQKDGKAQAEVKGVSGPRCVDLSKFLKELGQQEAENHTPDYYKDDQQGVTVTA